MRISDWSSDVCSSDLRPPHHITTLEERLTLVPKRVRPNRGSTPNTITPRATSVTANTSKISITCIQVISAIMRGISMAAKTKIRELAQKPNCDQEADNCSKVAGDMRVRPVEPTTRPAMTVATTRSEEHTSELQSLMRISY